MAETNGNMNWDLTAYFPEFWVTSIRSLNEPLRQLETILPDILPKTH